MVAFSTICVFTLRCVASDIIENKGQWPEHVVGAVFLSNSAVFIERGGYTIHVAESNDHSNWRTNMRGHVIKASRYQSNCNGVNHFSNQQQTRYYYHQKGKTLSCSSFNRLIIKDVYPQIDEYWIVENNILKYEWHVHPGGNPASIQMHYNGHDRIQSVNGSLEISTSLGQIREQPPISWENTLTGKKFIPCQYDISGNAVTLQFTETPDYRNTIIIDPELVFSTFSGSFSNNFGFTATYDQAGNLYSGSSAFGQNYPVTPGAYQTIHQGGNSSIEEGIDMAISKYSADGTTLIWSSFLGGSGDDLPLSMIVNSQMQLCVYGVTGSADFPVTTNAYDPQFSGGSSSSLSGTGANFPNGSDIVICKFSEDGSQLLASTYFGGSSNDGLNTSSALKYNYADEFRGEINLTSTGDILIVSSTLSTDFNLTGGAQSFHAGGQDIIIASFPSDLTSMNWGSYAGGSGDDSGFSITENFDGQLYITGGTTSTDFIALNGLQTSFGGGVSDAYVLRIAPGGNSFTAGTYFGGTDYDQFYFVSRDSDGKICVFGQTESSENLWIQNSGYSAANSGNCLVKFEMDLQNVIWATLFGTGDNKPNLSPAAFMADLCNRIYICGWGVGPDGGGSLNPSAHLAPMQNLATTSGCFDNTSVSGDFYMAVFDGNMSSLQYGSFIGGDLSSEHVDGGTSRFDRSGIIYQSICAGCGGNSDFPIYPGNAWSATNNSSCNNAVLKFDFQIPMTVASFIPQGPYCADQAVNFQQQSVQAIEYLWDFGDGNSSNVANPQHVFNTPGEYEITLVVSNPQTCNLEDSVSVIIEINEAYTLPDAEYDVCRGNEIEIGPTINLSNTTYTWTPEIGLNNISSPNPICNADTTEQYVMYSNTNGCIDTSVYSLNITSVLLNLISDTLICKGDSVSIESTFIPQEANIIWSFDNDFTNILPNQWSNLNVAGDSTSTYFAKVEYNGCSDTSSVQIFTSDYYIQVNESYKFCEGDTVVITNINPLDDVEYLWQTALEVISSDNNQIHLVASQNEFVMLEMLWNDCITADTIEILLSDLASVNFFTYPSESIINVGESVAIQITPDAYNYEWQPADYLDTPYEARVISTPSQSIDYNIVISDGDCSTRQKATIEVVQPNCAPPQVFVPNTFSPNRDGVNDLLFVRANQPEEMLFRIFNRWGELVFESRSINDGWDGSFRGQEVDPDIFTYYLEITCKGGAHYMHEGNITLTR